MFEFGRVVITRNALEVCTNIDIHPIDLLSRHIMCDWGDLDREDKAANNSALKLGGRLLSKYIINKQSFYVITEHDRSITTILLCSDY